jgi:hypothetical protein
VSWQNGLDWATSLGQYGIFAELAVMASLWILGAVTDALLRGRRSRMGELDGDD